MIKWIFTASALLFLANIAAAEDKGALPATQCLEEKISIAKLQQENAKLVQQLMQAQFGASQQAEKSAKAEEERLEKLLPKPAVGPEKK